MGKKVNEIQIASGQIAVAAEYTDPVLDEYKDNPLIEALPPILSLDRVEELLHVYPAHYDEERNLDAHYRYHCIQRLFRYFQPWNKHFDLEQRISRVIRQGYLARNPFSPDYAMGLQKIYRLIKEDNSELESINFPRSTASGFTVIGLSGVGKTKAIEGVLSLYPQIILHSEYKGKNFNNFQITYLKLDCPFDGSIKGLCANFFIEFDRLLGDNTYKKFASGRNSSVNTMLPRMAQLARNHSLGVLVIDEIQHLSLAKSGGSDKMLNFFVNLVNTIGVPVILIGTMKAMSVLQSEFRQARRGSGQGDMIWDRMNNDKHWDLMIEGMWDYQWTKNYIPLTQELKSAIYEESQGIIDIAVKLYAMAQMRAIATGIEIVTSKIIRQVAKDSLQLVRPMLLALKSGNKAEIEKYEDIYAIDIDKFTEKNLDELNDRKTNEVNKASNFDIKTELIDKAVIRLLEMNFDAEKAKSAVEEAMEALKSDIELQNLTKEAFKILVQGENDNGKPSDRQANKKRNEKINCNDENDLRNIVQSGKGGNLSAYEALNYKGFIKNPFNEFVKTG